MNTTRRILKTAQSLRNTVDLLLQGKASEVRAYSEVTEDDLERLFTDRLLKAKDLVDFTSKTWNLEQGKLYDGANYKSERRMGLDLSQWVGQRQNSIYMIKLDEFSIFVYLEDESFRKNQGIPKAHKERVAYGAQYDIGKMLFYGGWSCRSERPIICSRVAKEVSTFINFGAEDVFESVKGGSTLREKGYLKQHIDCYYQNEEHLFAQLSRQLFSGAYRNTEVQEKYPVLQLDRRLIKEYISKLGSKWTPLISKYYEREKKIKEIPQLIDDLNKKGLDDKTVSYIVPLIAGTELVPTLEQIARL